jgi:hypothetical protein
MDLTPYYGFEEDAVHFPPHRVPRCAGALRRRQIPALQAWCDEYFYLKHRNEQRGVGGVFFDDFSEGGFEHSFAMMRRWAMPSWPPTCPSSRAARNTSWRARARVPALPPRPLCGVQPGVGPGHALWPAVGRAHRIHPAVDAAAGQLGLPARPRPARPSTACTATSWCARTGFDAALQQLALDRLRIFPTGQAWHKARALSAAAHRLAMAQLAFRIGPSPGQVDARELQRPGPTYTIDTLTELQAESPGAKLFLIVGGDQAAALPSWHRWSEILEIAIIS